MPTRRDFLALAAGAVLPVDALSRLQTWPARPIRFVVPYPPGGNADSLARVLAERLKDMLGTPIVVENRPGATALIGTEYVSRAAPDGHTLLLAAATAFTVLPHLQKLPYDPANGFASAGGVGRQVAVVAVRKEFPARSMQELIDIAKRNPGKFTFGSAGSASVGHVSGEILKRAAGIDLLHVPFKGSSELAAAIVGGHIDLIIDGVALELALSGRARPIATFLDRRHPQLPDVPSLNEAGLDIRLPYTGFGVMAPARTPSTIMERIAGALEKIVAEPEVRDKLLHLSILASWSSPEEHRQLLERSRAYYGGLLREIGLAGGAR